ncbi:hypothetical protein [Streptosporangium nondiastaticum]|uniref:hypothetical protein n=1 Tax=Streptosporangium nondiastaticum TaxID=35764 RepID=UPI0011B1CF16|nr:hypothetical protein [Streptosporangium nondiastaticum]
MQTPTSAPESSPRPKRRKAKWLVVPAAVALTCLACSGKGILDEGIQEKTTACPKAMSTIGWKLPEGASDQHCEKLDTLAGSTVSGTFRIPRAHARPWLAALPGERNRPVEGAGTDGVVERREGLSLTVLKPPKGPADEVRITALWEGNDTAVVTFQTFDY